MHPVSSYKNVGQGLWILETLPCSCYGVLLGRGQSQFGHVYSCFLKTFVQTGLTSNLYQDLTDMSVEFHKSLHFCQINQFIVSFKFISEPDTWQKID